MYFYVWYTYIYVVYEGVSFLKDQSPLYPSALFTRHHFRVVTEVKEGQGVEDKVRHQHTGVEVRHPGHCGHFDMHTLDMVTFSS